MTTYTTFQKIDDPNTYLQLTGTAVKDKSKATMLTNNTFDGYKAVEVCQGGCGTGGDCTALECKCREGYVKDGNGKCNNCATGYEKKGDSCVKKVTPPPAGEKSNSMSAFAWVLIVLGILAAIAAVVFVVWKARQGKSQSESWSEEEAISWPPPSEFRAQQERISDILSRPLY